MPIGALMTAGALVLSNSPTASAATAPAPSGGTTVTEDPTGSEVSATDTESDTEKSRQTRTATVTVNRKLTSKVKAKGRATAKATKTAAASRTATATGYGSTEAEAEAQAKAIADQLAHDRAAKAAKARAGKLALAKAKKAAKGTARHRADVNVRNRFGTLVLRKARAQRGKPYRWGAQGPRAFDCSGLVRYVMHSVGVNGLPRTSQAMARKVHRVSKANKKRGDLIFFTSGSHVYHVAIYAGHGMIWHAPRPGKRVQKIRIWTQHYRVGRPV